MIESDTREECVMAILEMEGSASTSRIIELASTSQFEQLCRDCKSGVEVYDTAMRLYRTGKITRKAGPGGFVWALPVASDRLASES